MRTIQFKVGVFFVVMGLLLGTFVVYLLYAKDFFEHRHALYLTAPDAEDIEVGMPLVFSGISIGVVRQVNLTEKGEIQIKIEIPAKETRWLRQDSFFWLDRPMFGKAKIRVYSHFLSSPPLPADATRPLYGVDQRKESTQLVTRAEAVLENVERLTRQGGNLDQILAHLDTVSQRLASKNGMLEGILGSPQDAQRVRAVLDETHVLVQRHAELAKRLNTLTRNADQKFFAQDQVVDQLHTVLLDTRKILAQAGENLKKVDVVLANVQDGSNDLPRLRDEVENTLQKTRTLINELNDLWPIAKPKDLVLP